MQYAFGSGVLFGTPLFDASGVAITNPTPVKFGTLQEVTVDLAFSTKKLYGSLQFPVAIGRGTGSINLKAKFANLSGLMLNAIFFGQTLANGIDTLFQDTTGSVIPSTPFTITPPPPSSGTWVADLGVTDSQGIPYTRVASAPVTGQYSVAAGLYTFAAADATKTVFISFRYTATSTVAKKQTMRNMTLGYQPSFEAALVVPYNNKNFTMRLPNCVSNKLSLATKLEDFTVPDFEAEAFDDGSGNVGYWSTSE
jgi:hypothetical protein